MVHMVLEDFAVENAHVASVDLTGLKNLARRLQSLFPKNMSMFVQNAEDLF